MSSLKNSIGKLSTTVGKTLIVASLLACCKVMATPTKPTLAGTPFANLIGAEDKHSNTFTEDDGSGMLTLVQNPTNGQKKALLKILANDSINYSTINIPTWVKSIPQVITLYEDEIKRLTTLSNRFYSTVPSWFINGLAYVKLVDDTAVKAIVEEVEKLPQLEKNLAELKKRSKLKQETYERTTQAHEQATFLYYTTASKLGLSPTELNPGENARKLENTRHIFEGAIELLKKEEKKNKALAAAKEAGDKEEGNLLTKQNVLVATLVGLTGGAFYLYLKPALFKKVAKVNEEEEDEDQDEDDEE